MDRRLFEPRGGYPKSEGHLCLSDPVDTERWHIENLRAATAYASPGLVDRLKRLADDLEEHARQLQARQAAIAHRQRQLVDADH